MVERDESPLPRLPARPADGHKGTFGTVTIVGGCDGIGRDEGAVMIGAPALAARAALRAGCGRVRLVMGRAALHSVLVIEPSATGSVVEEDERGLIPSAMTARVDEAGEQSACVVVGPGLGRSEAARAATLRALHLDGAIVVVDADALRILAELQDLTREVRGRVVLTPHPGEFRALAAALRLRGEIGDERGRLEACAGLAARLGCVAVLKGHGTVVSDGLRAWVCARGGAELATAGTGDVLSGIIAGIAAQHGEGGEMARLPMAVRERLNGAGRALSLYDVARVGVEAHARAGEAWRARVGASGGMLARELADEVVGVVEGMRA